MIVADENIAPVIVGRLREEGYDVLSIRETRPSITDVEVLEVARQHEAVVSTDDKDFGELVVRDSLAHCGVLLLRLAGIPVQKRADMVLSLLQELGDESLNRLCRVRVPLTDLPCMGKEREPIGNAQLV